MNQIIIKLRPKPAPRPRVYNKRAVMPPDYMSYKELIAIHCRSFKKLEGNLKVELSFSYKTPKRPTTDCPVGDCDNLAKSVLDALEGIAYENDRQVMDLHIKKFYGTEDAVCIRIDNML